MIHGQRSTSSRLKAKNLKPIGKRASSSSGSGKGRIKSRPSSRNETLVSRKGKVLFHRDNPEFNPLLSVKTIFGQQNSTIHSLSSSLCIDALKQGCVDCFQEIFLLSHREPVLIDPVAEKFFSIGSNRLIQLQSELCQAEIHLRKKEFRESYDIYQQVSSYMEKERDSERAIYFSRKGKEVCVEYSGDNDLCRLACKNLGRLYHRLDLLDLSIEEHEEQMEIVEKDVSFFKPEDVKSCKEDLILAYLAKYNSLRITKKQSQNSKTRILTEKEKEEKEKQKQKQPNSTRPNSREDRIRACLSFLRKAYDLALSLTEDKTHLSKICLRIGKVYQKMNDFPKAMKYLLEYREICDELGDIKGSGIGDKHLANILQEMTNGEEISEEERRINYQKALSSYKSFLEKSRKSGVSRNIGKSCERIGYLLIMNNQASDSLPYFEENFELARKSDQRKDPTWLNTSKIRLGYARGVCGIKGFLSMIEKK